MNKMVKIGLATLAVSVAACGPAETSEANRVSTLPSEDLGAIHSATGTVDSVSGRQVTISHGPIKSLEWPAMTMPFTAKSAASIQGIGAGNRVAFTFSKSGTETVLTLITKQ